MRALLALAVVLSLSLVNAHARVEVILFGPYSSLAKKFLWQGLLRIQEALEPNATLAIYGCSLAAPESALPKIHDIIATTSCADAGACKHAHAALRSATTYVRVASHDGFVHLGSLLQSSAVTARVVYLAVDTQLAPGIAANLAAHAGVVAGGPDATDPAARATRLVLEKPIGRDAASSDALLAAVAVHAHPDATLIVDHYLAKPGLAAIAGVGSRLLPRLPSRIEAAILESETLDARTAFFGRYGITRDVMQSHLTQLVAAAAAAAGPAVGVAGAGAAMGSAARLAALRSIRGAYPPATGDRVGVYDGYEALAAAEAASAGGASAPGPAATAARHTLQLDVSSSGSSPVSVELLAGKALGVRSCFLRLWLPEGAAASGGTSVTVHVQGALLPPPGAPAGLLDGLDLPRDGVPAILIVQDSEAGQVAPGPGPGTLARQLELLGVGVGQAPWPWTWRLQERRTPGGGTWVLLATAGARSTQARTVPAGEASEAGRLARLLEPVREAALQPGGGSAAAYASLFAAAAVGDAGAFTSPDEVRELWRIWGPALDAEDAALANYAAAAGGAEVAVAADGHLSLLPVQTYTVGDAAWLLGGHPAG